MRQHIASSRFPTLFLFLCVLLVVLAACGGGSAPPSANGTPALAAKQVLTFPNVGTDDIGVLDPAQGPDANSGLAVGMIYSGLVRSDKDLNVIPDQATWQISGNNTVYTFTLKCGASFSDGTPVTAQTYAYTCTRALLSTTESPDASFFAGPVIAAYSVVGGNTTV